MRIRHIAVDAVRRVAVPAGEPGQDRPEQFRPHCADLGRPEIRVELFLDPSVVEGIDVARGPGSVAYGSDALGGVVSVRTRRAEPGSHCTNDRRRDCRSRTGDTDPRTCSNE